MNHIKDLTYAIDHFSIMGGTEIWVFVHADGVLGELPAQEVSWKHVQRVAAKKTKSTGRKLRLVQDTYRRVWRPKPGHVSYLYTYWLLDTED